MSDAIGGGNNAQSIAYSCTSFLSQSICSLHVALDVGKEIGRGGFAIVYKGNYQDEAVAIKQVIPPLHFVVSFIINSQLTAEASGANQEVGVAGESEFSDYFAEFRREVWLMRYSVKFDSSLFNFSKMKHKNVVQLVGVCTKPLCMVLEFCGGGDLFTWLHENPVPY